MKISPIQYYLKNSKPNATNEKDVKFYLDRLVYYQNLLGSTSKTMGYGEIEFEIDKQSSRDIYDFWFNAMIWFIETEKIKDYKKEKEKKKEKKEERL